MMFMIGTEKQIKWAKDIKKASIKLLYSRKDELGAGVYKAVENIENIMDSAYLINNLKAMTYIKDEDEKLKNLIAWMRYTEHSDFDKLLNDLEPVHWTQDIYPEIMGDFF